MADSSLRDVGCTCPNRDTMVGNCPRHGDAARLAGTYRPSLFSLASRSLKLTWDSPPETVGELLSEEWRKFAPEVLALLSVEEAARERDRVGRQDTYKHPSNVALHDALKNLDEARRGN